MPTKLMQEVADWKLEAKLENSIRYFYHTRYVDLLSQGKKSFVIGRKGTGKTAICEHLAAIAATNLFSQKLTFKNFPFNTLYSHSDSTFTAPNQYITIWKFLIYSTVCKLLSASPDLDVDSRMELRKVFDINVSHAFPTAIERLNHVKLGGTIAGTGGHVEWSKAQTKDSGLSLSAKVEFLEHYIHDRIGAGTFLILFDELDEDYKDVVSPEKYRQYTDLLTSLFKAAQDVRSRFKDRRLFPIVFLRDDIYDILQDPDKTKWLDYKIDLSWTRTGIQNLLAFRISRAIDPDGEILTFARAWGRLYAGGQVEYGNKQGRLMPAFDYITRGTQGRPRDYIRYIQLCADRGIEEGENGVTPKIVKSEGKSFSNYLRSELVDEIHGIIPEIDKILDMFSALRKQTLSIQTFLDLHNEKVSAGELAKRDSKFILQILFHFSVIGNVPRQANHSVFRYENREAELNMNERICLHRGLFKALQIL